jgi:hypothetical protein
MSGKERFDTADFDDWGELLFETFDFFGMLVASKGYEFEGGLSPGSKSKCHRLIVQ